MQNKFKVGDKVRVIRLSCGRSSGGSCGTSCVFTNEIGTITEITQDGIHIKSFKGMGDKWCSGFKENMLEFADKSKNIKIINIYGVAKFLKDLK